MWGGSRQIPRTCTYAGTHVRSRTHVCSCTCARKHPRTRKHVRSRTRRSLTHARAFTRVRTRTYVCTRKRARARACVFFLSIAFPGRAPTNRSRRFFLCLFYCCFCCCHVRNVSGGDVITVLACFVAVAVGTHVSLVVMSRANAGSWASDSASLKSLRAWAGSVYVYSLGLCLSVIVRNM